MVMAQEAWDAVKPSTIQHCWNHTGIQANSMAHSSHPAHADPGAWKIIHQFADIDTMTLPQAEACLKEHLGNHYVEEDWMDALKTAMVVKGDNVKVAKAVKKLASVACQRTGLVVKIQPLTKAPQLQTLEHELMKSIEELTIRRWIIGTPLTVDEILDPQEEKNIGQVTAYEDDDAIIAEIQRWQAIRSGELVEVESDDEDEDDQPKVCATELILLCKKLEAACIAQVGADSSLDLVHKLRAFQATLQRKELQNAKQVTLDKFWNTK
ncbi:uncharacterized protein F5147DRAFT_783247 [Suillus discolor]|uniref:DDE-1 domain-containing protein n=1 Tax=Suillus discolor TaxID=1912936 RepID=A0A9P7EQ66_9AGAM|nr:uncharacterized protein F5147DRAFT_783247 [Suillus discolor]KAG2082598.1 hypothetical protein F5147DRAFT_783247 [Suillus discolor]